MKPEPADVLGKIAKASDVAEALDSYNPPQPQYKALKAKLAEARKGSDVEKAVIPSGPVLKYGKDKKGNEELMSDARVPAAARALRHRRPTATPITTRSCPARSPSSRRSTA